MNPALLFLIGVAVLLSFWAGFCCGSDKVYSNSGDGHKFVIAMVSAGANIVGCVFVAVGLLKMITLALSQTP